MREDAHLLVVLWAKHSQLGGRGSIDLMSPSCAKLTGAILFEDNKFGVCGVPVGFEGLDAAVGRVPIAGVADAHADLEQHRSNRPRQQRRRRVADSRPARVPLG